MPEAWEEPIHDVPGKDPIPAVVPALLQGNLWTYLSQVKRGKPIRILIADDHPVVREGLSAILSRQPDMEVVGEASDGIEAAEQFSQYLPDITLLDLRMPRMNGAAAISHIRSRFPAAKIVIMSAYESEEEVCTAILAGAEGFLAKASTRGQLLGCIRDVHAGKKWIPPEIASALERRLASSNLSERELEVLNLLSAGKSNQDIGATLHETEETVEAHVNDILAKFDVTGRAETVTEVIKRGFLHLRQHSKHP